MLPVIENVSTIEEMMDMIDQPMFLLDVHDKEVFTFRRLNRCHQTTTGLTEALVGGQRPHSIFPQRLADTIVSNYEHCRETGQPYEYEEMLELPHGVRWWQTTLSPIKTPSGSVAKILGLAFDISERKEKEFAISRKVAELTRLSENLQVFAASATRDMTGPFETIIALLKMVQDGFVDLGDEKPGQLALCQEIAERSVEKMAFIVQSAEDLQVQKTAAEEIDIHHVASDFAALLDPHNRLRIVLPVKLIETDRVALQMILRNVMEAAVRYADTEISIRVFEAEDSSVAIVVADDGVGQSSLLRCDGTPVLPQLGQRDCEFGLASAMAVATSRGGRLERGHCPYDTGVAIKFTLPGRIIE